MAWNNPNLKFVKGDKDRFGYQLLDRANVTNDQCVDLWLSPDGIFYRVSVPKTDSAILSVKFDHKTLRKYFSYELYRSFTEEAGARKVYDALAALEGKENSVFFVDAALLLRGVEPGFWVLQSEKAAMPMLKVSKWYNESLTLDQGEKDEKGNRLHRRKNMAKDECLEQWETFDRKYIVCIKENEDNIRKIETTSGYKELAVTFEMAAEATRFFNYVEEDTMLSNNRYYRGDAENFYQAFLQRAARL